MAQFDFYAAPHGAGYWLDCQTDLMDGFNTRFIVPLLPDDGGLKPSRQLNPVFEVTGKSYVMATHLAGAVAIGELGEPAGSLARHRYEILNAFDFLISGV